MTVAAHIAQLQEKHALLDRKIAEAVRHPSVDEIEITALKRRKLQIKEEITRLGGTA